MKGISPCCDPGWLRMKSAAVSPRKYACVCSSVSPAVANQFSYDLCGPGGSTPCFRK